ncbi:MAG TPA: hypothetical protein VHO24_00430 [Opitutaceae bacterium]|nr:hypothetical protein [Opitutaceae bacterium]
MKTRIALLLLIASAPLLGGCTTTARQNTATAAAQYGTDITVVDKLERGSRLSFTDLEELGRRRVPDGVILAHLRRRDDAYRLTATEVVRLREAGVGDRVINYLLDSRERVTRRVRFRSYPVFAHHHHDTFGHYFGGFGHGGFGYHGGHRAGGHH